MTMETLQNGAMVDVHKLGILLMELNVDNFLADMYSAVIAAKFNAKVRIECESEEAVFAAKLALRVGKIASVVKLKQLQVDVVPRDQESHNRPDFCECETSLNIPETDDSSQENLTPLTENKIIFSANEGTILVLIGALVRILKSYGVFDDDDDFSHFLYSVIDSGIDEIERIPDVIKHQLLAATKEAVKSHVKKTQQMSNS